MTRRPAPAVLGGVPGGSPGLRPVRIAHVVALVVLLAAACSGDDTGGSSGRAGAAERSAGSTEPSVEEPSASSSAAGPPRPEAVDLRVVPLPATVTEARFATFSADGERVLFSGRPAGGDRVEVMSVAEDGSDLRCITCAVAPGDGAALLKPIAFSDGERIAVRVGEQSPARPADHAVVECRPSVADCAEAALVPIEPPAADDPLVRQDQREVRIAPDGLTVGLTQIRGRPEGAAGGFVSVVGALRRTDAAYVIDDPRVVSTLGELKGFTPDGRGVLVAAFTTLRARAANPDIVRVDLATGEVDPVTVDGDYDEDVSLAPDQDSYVVASGRGGDLFETVSQVRRPAFAGRGLEPLTAYLFAHHRRELLEPWLVPVGAEAQGHAGQQLNPGSTEEGFDGRTLVTWSPDGTRIVWWEGSSDPFGTPTGATRIVVAHLPDRAPVDPPAAGEAAASPSPGWAPDLHGFVPPAAPPPESRPGREGGAATVTVRSGDDGAEVIEVVYDGFTDDGAWVIDGTETVSSAGGLLGQATYRADLVVSGDHDGYLRADATFGAAGIDGSIESEVDGRRLRLPR